MSGVNLRIGQLCYIGWCGAVKPSARRFLCRIGTIVDGPFAPYKRFDGVKAVCPDRSWMVETDNGRAAIAEKLLFPFDDPSSGARASEKKAAEA